MDAGEFHFKEYDRSLRLMQTQQRNVDRLVFLRTFVLIIAVLFFKAYSEDLREIRALRSALEPISQDELNYTVLGYIAAHQRTENMIFVPDGKAGALMTLIPRVGTFLDNGLTLENQASQRVADVIAMAGNKPERIRIDNPYLPSLSIPVSYSMMVSVVFLAVLTSFFYNSYRRFHLRVLMDYVTFHLNQVRAASAGNAELTAKPALVVPGFVARPNAYPAIRSKAAAASPAPPANTISPRLWVLVSDLTGGSPYRLLNGVVTAVLSLYLVVLTAEILLAERGFDPRWHLKIAVIMLITGIPSVALHTLNLYFKSRYVRNELSFLTQAAEL